MFGSVLEKENRAKPQTCMCVRMTHPRVSAGMAAQQRPPLHHVPQVGSERKAGASRSSRGRGEQASINRGDKSKQKKKSKDPKAKDVEGAVSKGKSPKKSRSHSSSSQRSVAGCPHPHPLHVKRKHGFADKPNTEHAHSRFVAHVRVDLWRGAAKLFDDSFRCRREATDARGLSRSGGAGSIDTGYSRSFGGSEHGSARAADKGALAALASSTSGQTPGAGRVSPLEDFGWSDAGPVGLGKFGGLLDAAELGGGVRGWGDGASGDEGPSLGSRGGAASLAPGLHSWQRGKYENKGESDSDSGAIFR